MRCVFFLDDRVITDESRGWSHEWERVLCLTRKGIRYTCQAKTDVDNIGAGRAAKGTTLGKTKENARIFRHYINSPLCSNSAHLHHLEVIGLWKCILLFRGRD